MSIFGSKLSIHDFSCSYYDWVSFFDYSVTLESWQSLCVSRLNLLESRLRFNNSRVSLYDFYGSSASMFPE